MAQPSRCNVCSSRSMIGCGVPSMPGMMTAKPLPSSGDPNRNHVRWRRCEPPGRGSAETNTAYRNALGSSESSTPKTPAMCALRCSYITLETSMPARSASAATASASLHISPVARPTIVRPTQPPAPSYSCRYPIDSPARAGQSCAAAVNGSANTMRMKKRITRRTPVGASGTSPTQSPRCGRYRCTAPSSQALL